MGKQIIYLKEQAGSVLYYQPGGLGQPEVPIPFHEVGGDIGGIKLDDEREGDRPIIDALNECIKEHRGGVWLSNEAEYEAKKKLPIWRPFNPASEPLAVFRPNRPQPVTDRPEDVAAAANPTPTSRPIPGINPAMAAMLTQPGKPAEMSPAESGAAPPSAPPRIVKPRVGKASQKAAAPPPEPVTT